MNSLSQKKWIGGPTNKKLNLSFQDLENQRIMRILNRSMEASVMDECLNTNWFLSLEVAKRKIEDWRDEYNTFRPHSCLGDLTPEMLIENQVKTANFATLEYSRIWEDVIGLSNLSNLFFIDQSFDVLTFKSAKDVEVKSVQVKVIK